MIALTANYTAIIPGLQSSFFAVGGVGTITYSLLPGAQGSINSSTGVYQSPSTYCLDGVLATDSLGNQATLEILVGSPIQLVCDIISQYMNLSQGRVILYNTKFTIPNDSGIYIAVGISSLKSFGNSNRSYNGVSTQGVNMLARLDINVMSRSLDALNQKEQVLLAFGSTYAENQMEKNSFFIAPNSVGFVNLSQVEGSAVLYRYVITSQLLYFVPSAMDTAYFSQFPQTQIVTNP